MNHSPLFLQSLNSLIGKTMRQRQLATNDDVIFWLSSSVRWLNLARKAYKAGLVTIAYVNLANACERVKWAREYA